MRVCWGWETLELFSLACTAWMLWKTHRIILTLCLTLVGLICLEKSVTALWVALSLSMTMNRGFQGWSPGKLDFAATRATVCFRTHRSQLYRSSDRVFPRIAWATGMPFCVRGSGVIRVWKL